VAKNNVVQDCGTCYSTGVGWDGNSTNNCSDDGSHPGGSGQTGEVAFVDENGSPPDLRLDATDSVARENGADLSAEFFNDDIENESRPGQSSWDIGADEYTAGGGNQTPDDPTINDHNDGSWTSDNTPTLGFTQSDPDTSEQVKYQIQIDGTNNTFTNLVVDYTSDLMAEGAVSFTVGQAAGSGTYTAGSEGQTLSDGNYYWRVKTIDDEAAESGFATANSGSIAFKVDTTPPTAPGNLTENSKDSSSITLNFGAQTTESNFDTYKIFYKEGSSGVAETDTEHSDADLAYINYNGTSTTTISGLSASTQYVINIWAYDLAGNKASATEMTVTTDAGSSCSGAVSGSVSSVSTETVVGKAVKTFLHTEHRTLEPVSFKTLSSKLKLVLHSLHVIIIADPLTL